MVSQAFDRAATKKGTIQKLGAPCSFASLSISFSCEKNAAVYTPRIDRLSLLFVSEWESLSTFMMIFALYNGKLEPIHSLRSHTWGFRSLPEGYIHSLIEQIYNLHHKG